MFQIEMPMEHPIPKLDSGSVEEIFARHGAALFCKQRKLDSMKSISDVMVQLCRNRVDAENGFDELKNQWDRDGFAARGIERCQASA